MTIRAVLVLGGGSDIGLAIAHRFAREGHPVMLALRRPEEAEADVADLRLRHGVEATAHRLDALDLESAAAFLDDLPSVPGIVVSAIGLLGDQEQDQGDPAAVRRVVESNFLGPAFLLEAAAERLAALGEPTAIVGIGSVAGDRGRARNYWYGAAKAGFATMLSGLRQRYGQSLLRVITVKPGFVATRMTEGLDLPPPLTDSPEAIAELTFRAWRRGSAVATPWKWRLVMAAVRALPDPLFRRMRF